MNLDWSNADRYIWAVSFLLLVLVNLFLVVWYRPGSDRNAKRLAEKLHNAALQSDLDSKGNALAAAVANNSAPA